MKLTGILFFTLFIIGCKEPIKVAYANNTELFNNFELTKELTKELKEKELASQLLLDSIKIELLNIKREIEKTETQKEDNAPRELIKKHQLLYNEYLTKEKAFKESSETLALQYDEQIMKQLNEYIRQYAKEEKIEILFGAGNGNLLYAQEEMNVTQKLIEYANLKYKGK